MNLMKAAREWQPFASGQRRKWQRAHWHVSSPCTTAICQQIAKVAAKVKTRYIARYQPQTDACYRDPAMQDAVAS